jgi:multicomponent Na+:H+ antiporter subunit D
MIADLAAHTASTPPAAWLTILPVALMILAGAILATIRIRLAWHAPLALGALALLALLDAALLYRVATDGPLTMVMGRWLPPFGIAFTVDILGALLALAAALVALLACLFSLADMDTNRRRYGFYPMLMFLMAGVTGAFLTGDVFNLYVWFEVLLISSFGLLVLGGEPGQIDGAIKYGLLNLVGTTLFLIATGYLYAIFGTLNMADIAIKIAKPGSLLPLGTLAMLYFAAFAMKAGAFPVNFWLPAAYHTPGTTVSALFAGLLTKVGIYAMLRVLLMLMPAEAADLSPLIGIVAILTLLTGGFGAIGVSDIRRMLGYWVIAGIGVMLAGLALGGREPVSAAIFYMLHSMVVMAALYFLSGLIGRVCGSLDIAGLGGIYASAPQLSALALLLLLSIAGLPPLSGFWPKAVLVRTALASGHGLLAAAILVSGFLITFAAGRIFLLAFWRPGSATAEAFPRLQIVVVAVLAALSLVAGLWPEPLNGIASRAAAGLLQPSAYIGSVFPGGRP